MKPVAIALHVKHLPDSRASRVVSTFRLQSGCTRGSMTWSDLPRGEPTDGSGAVCQPNRQTNHLFSESGEGEWSDKHG
jgi:hypothetical protein